MVSRECDERFILIWFLRSRLVRCNKGQTEFQPFFHHVTKMLARSACEVVRLLKAQEVTPLQLIDEVEEKWKAVDPVINAVPIPCFERARAQAKKLVIPENPGTSLVCQSVCFSFQWMLNDSLWF